MEIEKKAQQYLDSLDAPIGTRDEIILKSFMDGAKEAETILKKYLWKSVDDILPPYDKSVLVRVDRSKLNSKQRRNCPEFRLTFRDAEYGIVKDGNDFVVGATLRVTHWMYIPELPKDCSEKS